MNKLIVFALLVQINLTFGLECYNCASSKTPEICGKEVHVQHAQQHNLTIDCNKQLNGNGIPPGFSESDLECTTLVMQYIDGSAAYTRTCGLGNGNPICRRAYNNPTVIKCNMETCKTQLCNQNSETRLSTLVTSKSTHIRNDRVFSFIHLFILLICYYLISN